MNGTTGLHKKKSMNKQAHNRRPNFFKRKYLVQPKAQLEVAGYFLIILAITMGLLYFGLTRTLHLLDQEVLEAHPKHEIILVSVQQLRDNLINQFFIAYTIVASIFALIGGIILNNRIFGPAYRLKMILTKLVEGKEPETMDCRKDDFLKDIFPLVKKLVEKYKINNKGMTIIELVVVVGLVGILSSIGTAQFNRFASKARQVAAKTHLSALYTAETVFRMETSSYTACLRQAGFAPEGQVRYYGIGFDNVGNNCGPIGGQSCYLYNFMGAGVMCAHPVVALGSPITASDSAYAPNVAINPAAMAFSAGAFSSPMVSNTQFVAMAIGSISPSTLPDIWTINHNKLLRNELPGF